MAWKPQSPFATRPWRDGTATTILLTENVHVGFDPDSTPGITHTWASPDASLVAFYATDAVCASGFSPMQPPNWTVTNSQDAGRAIDQIGGQEGVNPSLSSDHGDGVNIVFCDGSARFVSDKIDGVVYAALVSPAGSYVPLTTHRQKPVDDSAY